MEGSFAVVAHLLLTLYERALEEARVLTPTVTFDEMATQPLYDPLDGLLGHEFDNPTAAGLPPTPTLLEPKEEEMARSRSSRSRSPRR